MSAANLSARVEVRQRRISCAVIGGIEFQILLDGRVIASRWSYIDHEDAVAIAAAYLAPPPPVRDEIPYNPRGAGRSKNTTPWRLDPSDPI